MHHCGHQEHVCSDPNRVWYPQRKVCHVTMQEAAAQRRYREIHQDRPYHDGTFTNWTAEPTTGTPYHYLDGVEIYVAEVDINPGDEFLKKPDPFADRFQNLA